MQMLNYSKRKAKKNTWLPKDELIRSWTYGINVEKSFKNIFKTKSL